MSMKPVAYALVVASLVIAATLLEIHGLPSRGLWLATWVFGVAALTTAARS